VDREPISGGCGGTASQRGSKGRGPDRGTPEAEGFCTLLYKRGVESSGFE